MTQEEKDKHVVQFYQKYMELGLSMYSPKRVTHNTDLAMHQKLAYFYRINISAIQEMKKIGINLIEWSKLGFGFAEVYDNWYFDPYSDEEWIKRDEYVSKLLYESLRSNIVVEGKIIECDNPKNNGSYEPIYKVKVIKYYKGEHLFNIPPMIFELDYNFLEWKYNENYKRYTIYWKQFPHNNYTFLEGDKVLLFGTYFNHEDAFCPYMEFGNVKNVRKRKNRFIYPSFACFTIIDNKILDKVYQELLFLDEDYQSLINKIIKLEKINDTPNFYNRSFK